MPVQLPLQHPIGSDKVEILSPSDEGMSPKSIWFSASCMVVITGAPSLVGYDDDCCISYTVTIVDVRSCTRCTRAPLAPQGMYFYCQLCFSNCIFC